MTSCRLEKQVAIRFTQHCHTPLLMMWEPGTVLGAAGLAVGKGRNPQQWDGA